MVKLLFSRLRNRRFIEADLTPVFNEAALKIGFKSYTKKEKKKNLKPLESGERLVFHLEYNKRDISRKCIRDAYKTTCEYLDEDGNSFLRQQAPSNTYMKIKKVTIAYSRPENLRDKLVPSKLFETDSCNTARILKTMKSMRQLNGQNP